jgi:transcriptional regulator with XRE-family HTH domain
MTQTHTGGSTPLVGQQVRREALGQFLRVRRERITPAQVGLPAGGRRRTPGLRREELAQLAGVSASWYTWLEQGRDISVSAQVIESLARVLQLTPDERAHLFVLAHDQPPATPPTALRADAALQYMLDALERAPAYVITPCCNVVAMNEAARVVFAPWDERDGRERNVVWWVFTDPTARELFVDWEREAQRTLAFFRANSIRFVGQAWFTTLVGDLTAMSPEFRQWWPRHDVQAGLPACTELHHPQAGRLVFAPVLFQMPTVAQQQIVVYTPLANTETAEQVAALCGQKSGSVPRDVALEPGSEGFWLRS